LKDLKKGFLQKEPQGVFQQELGQVRLLALAREPVSA